MRDNIYNLLMILVGLVAVRGGIELWIIFIRFAETGCAC